MIAGLDFNSARSNKRIAIEYIKLLGKHNYASQFNTKKWTITNTPENRKYLKAFRDKWLEKHKDEPKQLRLDLDDFDVEGWLDETFGPDKCPPITVS